LAATAFKNMTPKKLRRQLLTIGTLWTVLYLLILASCSQSKKDPTMHFVVKDKKDTLSHLHQEANEKYQFYDADRADNLFSNKNILSKFPGRLILGIKDRSENPNRFLTFGKKSTKNFPSDTQVPFFGEEFLSNSEYRVEILDNYVDTLDYPTKTLTYIAIDKITMDTILFQELNYVIVEDNLMTYFFVYDNLKTKEEMMALLYGVGEKIQESVNTK
jgi:hypothetical protein